MNLYYSEFAAKDLEKIKKYLQEELHSIKAGKDAMELIVKTCKKLVDFPFLGMALSDVAGRETDYRFLIVRQYIVFYNIVGKKIWVRRIFNAKTDYVKHIFE